jgi:hypothetical protein
MSKITFKQNKNEISLNLLILRSNKRNINIHIDTDCLRTSDEENDEYEEVEEDEEEEEEEEEHNYESDIDEISNDDIYYDEQEILLNKDEIESI